jgi:hypothetical protein
MKKTLFASALLFAALSLPAQEGQPKRRAAAFSG